MGIVEGKLPPKVLSLVVEWGMEHKNELLENWESLQTTGKYYCSITPLELKT
jgi:hypothetical protein